MDILLKSVCVNFYPGHLVTVGAVADRIARLTGRTVTRVDDVYGTNGQHYCFVHFDKDMPEFLWDALGYNAEIFDTREGPIRVGLNETNGLDPNTEDEITQYALTDDGLYMRDFKTGVVRKWNEKSWVETTDPFGVDQLKKRQDVEALVV
jgi:hypothetical protein